MVETNLAQLRTNNADQQSVLRSKALSIRRSERLTADTKGLELCHDMSL